MSQINTLYSSFKELENQVAEKGRFTVIAIDGLAHKLGISQEGFPKFFVRTNSFASSIQNIIREILSIEYNVSCKLIDDAGTYRRRHILHHHSSFFRCATTGLFCRNIHNDAAQIAAHSVKPGTFR